MKRILIYGCFVVFLTIILAACDQGGMERVVTDLEINDIAAGSGDPCAEGDTVTVHYTLWLMDGTKLQSSVGGKPFTFTIRKGEVIQGWVMGVPGMRVGGRRELIIPARLAYGEQGMGDVIPSGATLKFMIEMLSIEKNQ